MRRHVLVGLAGVGLTVAAAPLYAHHAFSAEFDADKPLTFQGTVSKVEWVNPHAWIHIEVVAADGTKKTWMVEGGSPNSLFRRGVTRDSLQVGTEIIVDGYQSRDYTQPRANGRNITFVDGKKLFLGSSGTGAPRDGADPAEKKPVVQP
jgi:hypothetical protein